MAENLSSVAALANRLRVLQEQLADEPPSERGVFLAGEVKRTLGTVDPRERKAFLEELLNRFPAWDSAWAPPPPAAHSRARCWWCPDRCQECIGQS